MCLKTIEKGNLVLGEETLGRLRESFFSRVSVVSNAGLPSPPFKGEVLVKGKVCTKYFLLSA